METDGMERQRGVPGDNTEMKLPTMKLMQIASIAACLAAPAILAPVTAQAQTTMAPPVSGGSSAASNVWNWQDVPVGRQVNIVRAVFDQGGYQLYADTGETIVVPFTNNNLYVMKFGRTSGNMYFVNDGNIPTLYVPPGGYLSNSAASGSRWYPFDSGYHYTEPVYVGPAPTWSAFVDMGWYPGMVYYGGYWGYHPWSFGLSFSPMPGLYFNIGGHPYYGWNAYHGYYYGHPTNRVYVRNFNTYHYYNVGRRGPAAFTRYASAHGRPGGFARSANAGHGPGAFGGAHSMEHGASAHSFGGANRSFGAAHSVAPARSFGGAAHSAAPARSFGGGAAHNAAPARSFGGGGGASRTFGGAGGSHAAFGRGGGATRSFGGGGGAARSFGGGGGSHGSFGGGGAHAGGGGGHHR